MKKQFFTLLISLCIPCLATAQDQCSNIFENTPVHKGMKIQESLKNQELFDVQQTMHLLGTGGFAKVYLVDGKEIGLDKKVVKKTYYPRTFRFHLKLEGRARPLKDLEALEMYRTANIEGLDVVKVLKVQLKDVRVLERKPSGLSSFSDKVQLTTYLEYHEGVDVRTLWENNQLPKPILDEYNALVERVATYFKDNGNELTNVETLTAFYEGKDSQGKEIYKYPKHPLNFIFDSGKSKIGGLVDGLFFTPGNILVTKKGFVLIDPF